jgi:hypothetical protein
VATSDVEEAAEAAAALIELVTKVYDQMSAY